MTVPTVADDQTQTPPSADASAPPAVLSEAPANAESESPASSDAAAAAPSEEAAEGAKRRVRLNPTFDPQRIKPIPTLTDAEANAEPAAPANPDAVPAADAAVQEAPAPKPAPLPKAPPVEIPTQSNLDAEMEAEIAAALESGEIGITSTAVEPTPAVAGEEAAAPEPAPTLETATEGTKLSGTIQAVHEDNVFLDFGWRLSGVVSLRQFSSKKPPVVGEKLDVVVDKVDEEEGLIACRLPRGTSRISGDWHAMTPGQIVDCVVTKTNKGGLDVTVGTLRGFMPASQADLNYVADLQTFVGQKLRAKVTEVNPARRRLVVSRRQVLQEERAVAEQELMTHLEVGQTVPGKVKTIKDYGAFVDIGGVDGFLHIGQMSWVRINHPSEVLTEGQQVEVKVLSIDSDKKKISLGMRQLSANPWVHAEGKYAKGTVVSGKVTRTEAFGAFIELEPGIEGLVHISELDYKRVRAVTDVLSVGQTVEVQVLEVDPQKKRVSLSVKALKAKPEEAAPAPAYEAPKYIRKEGLKGGIGGDVKGGLFGDPGKFGR
ncbi:MAG: S1 RNA-binding domain-containing protein [Planctomycetaceae bacterium]|nr:S1 RNA-binding domain-containing protein [Planctomycetaceae bacterium]